MGGFGSGQKRWWLEVPEVELPVLDCRVLRRRGLLAQGSSWELIRGGWALSFVMKEGSIVCAAAPPSILVASAHLEVELTTTEPHYGGVRHWMLCPDCGRRVATLYWSDGPGVACRSCVGHLYESQLVPERLRGIRKAARIRELLGGEPGFGQLFPERPRGMARARYERLRREAENAEAAFIEAERERMIRRHVRAQSASVTASSSVS